MGRQHRVTKVSRALSAWAASAVLLSGAALCGCAKQEDQKAQMRRDVLRANDFAAERRKQLAAVRVLDDNGKLVPSNQRIAGVVLPRGYEPKFKLDYESYFDGELPYSKLATYFTEQLDFIGVQRPNSSTLTFLQARSKGDSQMKPVTVTISPVPGREDWSRIRVVAPQPLPEHLQSKAEIDAELARRRQREMY
jgi:hypothetical protein